jgi:hypothetical protein
LRIRKAEEQSRELLLWLEDWAGRAGDHLEDLDPDLPDELNDRAADAWEPLLAIADMASGDWPARARAAAVNLSGDEPDDATYGTQLLIAVRGALDGQAAITTADLLVAINANEELPFGGWSEGKGLNATELAKYVRPYGIRPRNVRIGEEQRKGYHRADLLDAWERYLPTPESPSQASQASQDSDPSPETPHKHGDGTDGTDGTALTGKGADVPDGDAQLPLATRLEDDGDGR